MKIDDLKVYANHGQSCDTLPGFSACSIADFAARCAVNARHIIGIARIVPAWA